MIIIIIGNVGTGKTVSMIRQMLIRINAYKKAINAGATKKPYKAVINFNVPKIKQTYRIKIEDIVLEKYEEKISPTGKKVSKLKKVVNWGFWENLRDKYNYDIFLDEFNSVVNARDSNTANNKIISKWLFQIRKILGSSELNNIYIVTQHQNQIDINFLRLAHLIIGCSKIILDDELEETVLIKLSYYKDLLHYEMGESFGGKAFKANKFFDFYDSYQLVKFGDEEVYL